MQVGSLESWTLELPGRAWSCLDEPGAAWTSLELSGRAGASLEQPEPAWSSWSWLGAIGAGLEQPELAWGSRFGAASQSGQVWSWSTSSHILFLKNHCKHRTWT